VLNFDWILEEDGTFLLGFWAQWDFWVGNLVGIGIVDFAKYLRKGFVTFRVL
jgi:hypothetical protein